MKVGWLLLLCALLVSAAAFAKDAAPVQPDADVDPDEEESFSLVVTDLPPGKEEKTPTAEDGEQQRLARILAMVKEGESLGSTDLSFLRRRREAALTPLRTELKAGWKKSGTALETLMSLGDADARAQWFAEFQKGNMEAREELLGFLTHDESGEDLLKPRNREEEDVFRAALDPKQFVLGAAFRINDRPGVVSLLLDQLPELPREDQWSVAGVITSGVWTPEEGRRFLTWAREQAGIVREKELTALQEVAADIMEKGGETVVDAEKLFLELHARDPKEILRSQGMARAFSKGATPASRALLEKIVDSSKDPVIRADALAAITRQRGPEMLKDLEPFVKDQKRALELWGTLTFLAEGGARENVNEFVLRNFPDLDEKGVAYVLRHGNPDLLRRAEEGAKELRPDTRFALEWKLKNRTLAGFFERLKERGLISRVPTKEEIAQTTKSEGGADLESDRALRLLAVLEAQLQFDSEADEVPPAYDRLFDRFVQFTRGAFAPRAVQQRSPKPKSEDEDPPITIEFIVAGKQFTLKPRPLGDWYDVEAVQAAVNRALEVTGKAERILAVESAGQEATFVFGPPAAWQEIAKEYSFPLASGASDAVQQGKDFEKRAIETLKKRNDASDEE